jgi:anti-sigma factor RsiW
VIAWALKEMPMASVAAAAAEEMMSENEELMAKCKAMEEELAKYKAAELEISTDEEEDDSEKEMAKAAEEEKVEAKAKSGVKPVAKARTSGPSASVRWNQAVDAAMAKTGNNKMKAVALANRNHPGLREAFLAEANAR